MLIWIASQMTSFPDVFDLTAQPGDTLILAWYVVCSFVAMVCGHFPSFQ